MHAQKKALIAGLRSSVTECGEEKSASDRLGLSQPAFEPRLALSLKVCEQSELLRKDIAG
jgi:hypothetical protein